jgi:hypothetical protein
MHSKGTRCAVHPINLKNRAVRGVPSAQRQPFASQRFACAHESRAKRTAGKRSSNCGRSYTIFAARLAFPVLPR